MFDLNFDPQLLRTMIGGSSALDMPALNFKSRGEVADFLAGYGFQLDDEADSARLWSYHRRAVTYLETQLLVNNERVPEALSEAVLLKDIANLFLFASDPQNRNRQRWACAILRVMHVLNHLSNDLFTAFSDEIQDQILRPYQDAVVTTAEGLHYLGAAGAPDQIPLHKFDVKPFKTSNSSITKLLAKPEEVAFGLLDKMGVRFVTNSLFDCFAVMRWLLKHNVVSYPHLIPDQSNNTLYPLNLFFEAVGELVDRDDLTHDFVDQYLQSKLNQAGGRAEYREKRNIFTSRDYRFIKFIVRRLIRARHDVHERPFMFFYPYEVQIMDRATYERNAIGPSSHVEYKARQRTRARERVFGRAEVPSAELD